MREITERRPRLLRASSPETSIPSLILGKAQIRGKRKFEDFDKVLRSIFWSVPLEPLDQQHWQAAAGYVELGMFWKPTRN